MKKFAWCAAVGVALLGGVARAATPAAGLGANASLLKDKFTVPESACLGWGSWRAPFVVANPGTTPVKVQTGEFTLPPGAVAVHPAPDQDVAIAWRSPLTGKVALAAKFHHVHVGRSDGVSWAVRKISSGKLATLAEGVLERNTAHTVAAEGKFAAVTVKEGDALLLAVGPRGNYQYDTTLVECTLTELEGKGRTWHLLKDVSADMHAGNPHADAHGNAAVWHFVLAPARALGAADPALTAPRPTAGEKINAWTIGTEDTRLSVGATKQGQLVIYECANPAAGWNWTREPAVFPLVQTLVSPPGQTIKWQFKDGQIDKALGQKLVLRFVAENPALELASEWWARPGRGPVRHTVRITNRSDKPIVIPEQTSMHADLAAPSDAGPLTMWTFHTDGPTPDRTGIYRDAVTPGFQRQIVTHSNGAFIPYALFDAGGKHGAYVGIEWGYCRIAAAAGENDKPGAFRVRGGEFADFRMTVAPGETLEAPPAFLGVYQGDADDAGNSLRKYLWNYSMPEFIRKDASYPKVQWNGFIATGTKAGSWKSEEKKYYPFVDDIAALGFEEVMLDVGWWQGGTGAAEPVADPVNWPSGMTKAADYAHKAGLRFGLYWNKGEAMASPAGRAQRSKHIKQLYNEYKADMWRSDSTGGSVMGGGYAEVKGFYQMLDQLSAELPGFQWENCVCGGRIKDFGSMARAVKVFITDTYAEVHIRQAFYDGSYMYPPAQLEGCVGSTNGGFQPKGVPALRFAWRSTSMGAPEWFLDAPNGGNTGRVWTAEEKAAVKKEVETYKTRIRPLVRNGDVYHILPRPNDRDWDGIQYYDPATRKGVAYLFKPGAAPDAMTIRFRGVEAGRRYAVSFQDESNPPVEKTGAELLAGMEIKLSGRHVSELVWVEGK